MPSPEITKQFTIGVDLKNVVPVSPIEVTDGDTGVVLVLNVSDGGTPVDLTDCRLVLGFAHSRGVFFQSTEDESVTVDGSTAVCALLPDSFAPGLVECELQIFSGSSGDFSTLVTSARFGFTCRESILGEDPERSVPQIPLLTALISAAEDAADAASAAAELAGSAAGSASDAASSANSAASSANTAATNASNASAYIAPAFSTSSAYSAGDHVIYNGALYRFITAHSAGAWNSAEVTQVVLSDEMKPALGAVTRQTEKIGGLTTKSYWNSQTSTAVLTTLTGWRAYDPVPVTPGKEYLAVIYEGSSNKQHPLLFVDGDYAILGSYRRGSAGLSTFFVTAPAGSVYALITTPSSANVIPSLKEISYIDVQALEESIDRWELLKGKTVAIIGDSISTNGDPTSGSHPNAVEITVEEEDLGVELSAYLTAYDVAAGLVLGGHTFTSDEIGTEVTFTPTRGDEGKVIGLANNYNSNALKTWWEVAMEKLEFTPIPVCWSGASITSHEKDTQGYKTSYAWHDAQIRKCGIRTPGTMTRTAPDVIIVYRGTNDFSHSPYAKLTDGYFGGAGWSYPVSEEVTGGYGFKEGLSLLVKKLRAAYPTAVIFLCTLNVFKRVNCSAFPTNNGVNTLPEYNNAIREAADFLGCGLIEFDKDGITFENCYTGGYITDSATTPTHPSAKGHAVMGNKAIADIKARFGGCV